jgi:bisphosphoglycerate-dependent phosphoglycerate mutase family 1
MPGLTARPLHASLPGVRRLLIVRHGESEWNREGRWQGWIDIALTGRGEAQARARGAELHADGHRFAAVHSSDLVRAARTATLLSEALDGPPARPERALRERFGGDWQGLNREEITARWPDERAAWRRGELSGPPNGETDADVLGRVCGAIAAIDAAAPEGPVLIVSHHGVVRQLTMWAGVTERGAISNLGGRWFEWDGAALHAGAALPPLAEEPDTDLE